MPPFRYEAGPLGAHLARAPAEAQREQAGAKQGERARLRHEVHVHHDAVQGGVRRRARQRVGGAKRQVVCAAGRRRGEIELIERARRDEVIPGVERTAGRGRHRQAAQHTLARCAIADDERRKRREDRRSRGLLEPGATRQRRALRQDDIVAGTADRGRDAAANGRSRGSEHIRASLIHDLCHLGLS